MPDQRSTASDALLTAEIRYISDPQGRSLRFWYETCVDPRLGWTRYREYAVARRWTERRRLFRDQVSEEVLAAEARKAVQSELAELGELRTERGALAEMLQYGRDPQSDDQDVQPKQLPFTPEEMRSVEHMLLAKRRTRRRAELNIADDDAADLAVG